MTPALTGYLHPLRTSGLLVFLTGAGVSAESGIPTFRGEEGYWKVGSRHYRPMELATRHAFESLPDDVWSWYLYRRTVCRAAEPNGGHRALVELERRLGERFLLVTQNVDGLHLRAGNSPERTYQVHGNLDYFRCSRECCPDVHALEGRVGPKARGEGLSSEEKSALLCPACGAPGRPHVLWFDECYDEPRYRYESARQAARTMRGFVSAGSSGATNLPMQMANLAQQRGVLMVDLNVERNPFSQLVEQNGGVFLRGPASEGFARVLEALGPPL